MIPDFCSTNSVSVVCGRREGWRRALRCLLIGLLLVTAPGCNYMLLLGYLIGGPPQEEPQFEKETKKSMTDKDVRVAVVCYAPDDLKYKFENVDHILAKAVSVQLANNKIDVVPYDEIRVWLDENPDWDTAVDIGAEFDVTYVIYVDVSDFSLYERDTNALMRGRCDAIVSVYEMETDGEGTKIFYRELNSVYPTEVPRSSTDTIYDKFRMEYLRKLSDDIGRMFYPWHIGDQFSHTA
jgi:hypothetical protein